MSARGEQDPPLRSIAVHRQINQQIEAIDEQTKPQNPGDVEGVHVKSNELIVDVEGPSVGISVSELPIEICLIVTDNHLVQSLQRGDVTEDEKKTSFEEPNDLRLGIQFFQMPKSRMLWR
ncbi:hypothetical protein LIER_12350 [Lithospermum erythrorhizon]|uniref:Uncharacterized protein n=1 Tax=Lithospermum erythrorhizon TaxID=34254 RepID=A0AAV3PVT2_LITER